MYGVTERCAAIDAEIEIARDHPGVADGTDGSNRRWWDVRAWAGWCAAWNGRGGGVSCDNNNNKHEQIELSTWRIGFRGREYGED